LNGGTTRRSVLAERANADTVNRTHGRTDPSNAVQSHEELYTLALRSENGCAPERAPSVCDQRGDDVLIDVSCVMPTEVRTNERLTGLTDR